MPERGAKMAFIAAQPMDMPPEEVVAKAQEAGLDTTVGSVEQMRWVIQKRRSEGLSDSPGKDAEDEIARAAAFVEPIISQPQGEIMKAAKKAGIRWHISRVNYFRRHLEAGTLAALAEKGRALPPAEPKPPKPSKPSKALTRAARAPAKKNYSYTHPKLVNAALAAAFIDAHPEIKASKDLIRAAKKLGIKMTPSMVNTTRYNIRLKTPATLATIGRGKPLLAERIAERAPAPIQRAVKRTSALPAPKVVSAQAQIVDGLGIITDNERAMLRMAFDVGIPRSAQLLNALHKKLTETATMFLGRD